jgi:hypothetical protein
MMLEDSLKLHWQKLQQLEDQLGEDFTEGFDAVEQGIQIADARSRISKLADSVHRKRAALRIGQRAALQKMKDDVFLKTQMNARALKTRIRDCLHQRKFELEQLERSYRHVVNSESYD